MTTKQYEVIGGLWENVSRDNVPYLSGKIDIPGIGSVNVSIFPNKFHSGSPTDTKPRWVIYARESEIEALRALIGDLQADEHPF